MKQLIQTRVFALKNINPKSSNLKKNQKAGHANLTISGILDASRSLLTKDIGSLHYDKESNSVIVTDTQINLERIKNVIEYMDSEPEFFNLKVAKKLIEEVEQNANKDKLGKINEYSKKLESLFDYPYTIEWIKIEMAEVERKYLEIKKDMNGLTENLVESKNVEPQLNSLIKAKKLAQKIIKSQKENKPDEVKKYSKELEQILQQPFEIEWIKIEIGNVQKWYNKIKEKN